MTYDDAIGYLLSFADFERTGRFHRRPDLGPVRALLGALGDPQTGRRTVHITGSKGKGSVAAMVESCLRAGRLKAGPSAGLRTGPAAPLKTGLYTSPHLHDYTERIAVGGEPVSRQEFARLAERTREAVEAITPELGDRRLVTFDLLTATAFLAFRDHTVDVQVIEVGLGGRLDSTNVFEAKDVAVFTPVSLEHTAVLGDTPEAIARDKAGIITPGCTAVIAPQPYEAARDVLREAAGDATAHIVDVAAEYSWRTGEHGLHGQLVTIERPAGVVEARLPLLGSHQAENAATAVAAVDALRERAGLAVSDEEIAAGLAAVRWPGRMEVLREYPLVIADGAHNAESARRLLEALYQYAGRDRAVFIVGSLADKDIGALAAVIAPAAERVLATRSRHPRAMPPEQVEEAFRALGASVQAFGSVSEAVDNAIADAPRDGVICLLGSLFVAAEGREVLLGLSSS